MSIDNNKKTNKSRKNNRTSIVVETPNGKIWINNPTPEIAYQTMKGYAEGLSVGGAMPAPEKPIQISNGANQQKEPLAIGYDNKQLSFEMEELKTEVKELQNKSKREKINVVLSNYNHLPNKHVCLQAQAINLENMIYDWMEIIGYEQGYLRGRKIRDMYKAITNASIRELEESYKLKNYGEMPKTKTNTQTSLALLIDKYGIDRVAQKVILYLQKISD